MAKRMKEKHDKYWGNIANINILLFVAVLLDPRYKFKFVEWSFGKKFYVEVADSMSWKVKNGLYKMYDYYKLCFGSNVRPFPTQSNQSRNKSQTNQEDDRNLFAMEFDKDMNEEDNPENKSEIDQYLLEPRKKLSSQFDILNWWKVNSTKFPILALIARDVLAMPISTVAFESAFSTGGRVIDTYRSSLAPKTIEALICAQNWFRSKPLSMEIEECVDDIEKLELGEIQIINSWTATKILFNPNIFEVDEFKKRSYMGELTRQRFTQSVSQTASSGDGDFLTSTRRLTINQIKETNETGIFVTLATILKIQTNFGWFYESCNKCMKKIRNENGLLLCPSCNKTPPVIIPRFKIHVQVIDHTGNATFVLFDRQGYQVLQKIAKELRDQLTEKYDAQEDDNNFGDCEELGRTSEVASVISENETDHCLTSNITPSKRASLDDVQTVGLTEMLTPQMYATKPTKQIKKEKFE
ncbi:zinc finger BED domain-containing protein RICESLEEPER 2-like [Senna tora]|uniref:Zinc finger BED domain-containing protein RICESLEEPER 2-like n=1 Tax=Senna tora TaxID=362788 RepID=A0A835CI39_9FABA|nr:zinc finger BED domain-containing protein RICESLEEPER 2-like [Senna tora]